MLYNHNKEEAISIRQNEIDTAETPVSAFATIGEVLTDKSAIISNSVILIFILYYKIIKYVL